MHFTTLLIAAFAAPTLGYPIDGSGVHCRSGPSTSNSIVKTYDKGTDVTLTCQTPGESIQGDTLWDKTSDNCYVADFYVKTGTSNSVVGACDTGGGGGGGSTTNGEISRSEILSRGEFWISRHVPYSMTGSYPDPQGVKYRTDCSGFVSMALHSTAPGDNTVSLLQISTEIAWNDLQPGDYVGTLGDATGGAGGHVTLFKSWTDSTKKNYNSLECKGTQYGCLATVRGIGWTDGPFTSKPYRYVHVQ